MFSSRSCFSNLCPRPNEWALAPTPVAATVSLLAAATHRCADVAELADALDSKSGTRKSVWVRPPPSAPNLLLLVLALAQALQHGKPGLFRVGNRERLELVRRRECGDHFAHRLFARRTPGQFRSAQRPAQRELPTANCAITFAEFGTRKTAYATTGASHVPNYSPPCYPEPTQGINAFTAQDTARTRPAALFHPILCQ